MSELSDFRSDTVTQPTAEMRRAMADAPVGDDVLDGDPTVAALERAVADWLGKDGALFVPSGTMANQVALGSWTSPGEEVVLEAEAHIVRWEAGAASALHGAQLVTLPGERGMLPLEAVRAAVRPDNIHCAETRLVCVEQTHMGAGGAVLPLAELRALASEVRGAGVRLHIDGARLANAEAASGVPAAEFAACADSVSVCFSKGLGAPVGSAIAGDRAFLDRARVIRKRLGGWMRQAGVIAAGALWALEHNRARLAQDHALARALAERLDAFDGLACPPARVETNLVMVEVSGDLPASAAELSSALKKQGVLVDSLSPTSLRFVTHLDVGPADVERAEVAMRAVLS